MKVILTKHAFERYCERGKPDRFDYSGSQNYLRQEAIEGICFFEWRGKPVVYLHQAYWRYEYDTIKRELTLITCLAILELIGTRKWSKQKTARNNRYTRKLSNKSVGHSQPCDEFHEKVQLQELQLL